MGRFVFFAVLLLTAPVLAQDPQDSTHDRGTTVRLAATAADGWAFSHWEDADGRAISVEDVLVIRIEDDAAYTAVFLEMRGSLSLAVGVEGSGAVDVSVPPVGTPEVDPNATPPPLDPNAKIPLEEQER